MAGIVNTYTQKRRIAQRRCDHLARLARRVAHHTVLLEAATSATEALMNWLKADLHRLTDGKTYDVAKAGHVQHRLARMRSVEPRALWAWYVLHPGTPGVSALVGALVDG